MNLYKKLHPERAIDWPVFAQKSVATARYTLKWLEWGVDWLVIRPLVTLILAGAVLAWHSSETPGKTLVQFAESISINNPSGVWSYPRCTPHEKSSTTTPCSLVKTDAAGYAAYIDHTLGSLLRRVWFIFAVLYTGFALVTRQLPTVDTHRSPASHTEL